MDLMLNFSTSPIQKGKKVLKPNNVITTETKITENVSNDSSKTTSKITTKQPLKSVTSNSNTQTKSFISGKSSETVSKVVHAKNPKKSSPTKPTDKSPAQPTNEKSKSYPKSTLDLDDDANVKDMERFLGSTAGVNSEPVFSDKSFTNYTELHPHLIKTLSDRMKITISTSIQEKAIPAILEGRDVLIKSATGSGKTLSYAVPLINSLASIEPPIDRRSGVHALIISPTQELATQTLAVLTQLTNPFVRIVTGVLMGGVTCSIQKRAIKKGLNVVIATPNRLIYHLDKTPALAPMRLNQLRWLIIDEADRMTELGFAGTVQRIIEMLGARAGPVSSLQTVLLSATLTPGVENLAGLALTNPFRAEVDFLEKPSSTESAPVPFSLPTGLQHYLLVCPTKLRMVALLSFLLLKCKYGKRTDKVVVFMATKDIVEFHYQLFHVFLRNKSLLQELPNTETTCIDQHTDIDIFQLHGGMEHEKRQAVFKEFSACNSGFLLTTDVCSRGLDMTGINWVVQYHPPGHPIDYIHRVGRTARAGSRGKALLFLQPAEVNYISYLQTAIGGLNIQKVSLRSVMQTALHHAGSLKSRKSVHTVDESVFLTAKVLEEHVSADPMLKNLGRNAFKSLVGNYACFSTEMRQFFCYKDLHLGHVAKSLACTETPKEISKSCMRNVDSDMSIDKQKKLEANKGKRKLAKDSNKEANKTVKKPKLDQAHRNMLAEYGL